MTMKSELTLSTVVLDFNLKSMAGDFHAKVK